MALTPEQLRVFREGELVDALEDGEHVNTCRYDASQCIERPHLEHLKVGYICGGVKAYEEYLKAQREEDERARKEGREPRQLEASLANGCGYFNRLASAGFIALSRKNQG